MFANVRSQGLLDILQQAASRAASPAISIPETVPDSSVEESQTQRRSIKEPVTLEFAQNSLEGVEVPVQHLDIAHSDHEDEQQFAQVHVADSQCQDNEPAEHQYTELEPTTAASQSASESISQGIAKCDQQQQIHISQEQSIAQVEASASAGFADIAEIPVLTDTPTFVLGDNNAQQPGRNDALSDTAQTAGSRVDDASQPLLSQQVRVRGDSPAVLTESSVPEHSQHLLREQNAQVVHLDAELSTQEDTIHSIRPTIETDYVAHRARSESRHDSSQESPGQPLPIIVPQFFSNPLSTYLFFEEPALTSSTAFHARPHIVCVYHGG